MGSMFLFMLHNEDLSLATTHTFEEGLLVLMFRLELEVISIISTEVLTTIEE